MFNWRRNSNKTISIAIQGGASHGAFVWGVLDRLLEEERLGVEGVSGTSSGAINGVLLADGLMQNGTDGAREKLETFWWRMSEACHHRRRSWFSLHWLLKQGRLNLSSTGVFYDLMSRLLLPYDFNPANMNPLRKVIGETVDFDRLHDCNAIKLFINATNVRTNKIKIFENGEITLDAVCASACLPFLFQPVEIDGEHYWDGGYMGNPAIYPLIYECAASDILLIQANPIKTSEPPKTASQLLERISEISFTSTLMREMRAISLISNLVEGGRIKRSAGMRKIRMHMVEADESLDDFDGTSKFNADWWFLERLHKLGRKAADEWLTKNFEDIGERSTVDINETFL